VIQNILGSSGFMDEIKSKIKVVGLDPGQEDDLQRRDRGLA